MTNHITVNAPDPEMSNQEWTLIEIHSAITQDHLDEIAANIGQDAADDCDYTTDPAGFDRIRHAWGLRRDELERDG